MDIEKLKFPIGEFRKPELISETELNTWSDTISSFPQRLSETVSELDDELEWRYRPEGWSIRQVIHHCADSHMNAFIRFKLTLTEDSPEIRPYFEDRWAEMADTLDQEVEDSLLILKGVHSRWTTVINNLKESEIGREYIHPEYRRKYGLNEAIGLYAWHCDHHLAHVLQALEAQGKYN